MARVALLDDYQKVALHMAAWDSLPADTTVRAFHDHLADEDALAARLKDFDIIMAMRERTPFSRSLLTRLPNLRLLVTSGMRNASIDVPAASDAGITVCGTGGLPYPTAELTWALILGLLRYVPHEDHATRHGQWQISVGYGLQGKTLGVIGLGRLGSQVATVAKAFNMEVLAWSQNLTAERAQQYGATLVNKADLLREPEPVAIERRLFVLGHAIVGPIMRPLPAIFLIRVIFQIRLIVVFATAAR